MNLTTPHDISKAVTAALESTPIVDMHTHLYPPTFGTPDGGRSGKNDKSGLLLWGVDELLTYHYLVAEVFRLVPATKLPYESFWRITKREQADHIFKHLFLERAPISEACRGVLTSLKLLGLDPADRSPDGWRKWFAQQDPSEYIDKVMHLSNVKSITMTNAVFDDNERQRWLDNPKVGSDPRFTPVLRMDPLLRDWPGTAAKKLTAWGYPADETATEKSIEACKKFLRDWIKRMNPIYLALSLPPEFRYPALPGDKTGEAGQKILEEAILLICREHNLPFAMMIGSKMRVNPALGDAGDMVGKSDVQSVVNLCHRFPENRFFCTMLARENQHELAVAARKFGNLMVFGCWWFINNPSLIEETTRLRVELLGTSFIPQHSDARVLDQLLYKWDHSRQVLAKVLTDKFSELLSTGRPPTREEVDQTAKNYLSGNFQSFLRG